MKRLRIGTAGGGRVALRALCLAAALACAAPAGAEELWETQPAQPDQSTDSAQPPPPDAGASDAPSSTPSGEGPPSAPQDESKPQPAVETIPAQADAAAPAPASDATQLETIEVSSEKRVKAQRDIPGSVGAIRGADLEKMRAQSMRDYMKLIPGVVYADQGNEESSPVIRGIATSLSFGATATPTGVYLDDMPFADLFAPSSVPDLNPFDLERVEVLKGPQGTLFGSGALAGAVRYIVQKPEFGVWQGKVMATMSQTRLSDGLSPTYAGAVNVPVFGDALALRGVGLWRKDAGVYDESAVDGNGNTLRNDKDADRQRQTSWRVLGSWNALDALNVSAFWFDQKTHNDDFGLADQVYSPQSDQFPFPSPRDHDFGGGNLSVNYDFGWAHVLSSTNRMTKHNYTDSHSEFGFEIQNQNANEYVNVYLDDIDGYTQELRLSSPEGSDSPWEWLIGGSFLHYGNQSMQYSYVGPDMPDPTDPGQVSDTQKLSAQVFATTDQVAYETAAFGEATWKSGGHFEITAGLRDYVTKLKANTDLCGAQIIALFQELCYPQHFDDKAKGLNPKLSVRYIHNSHVQAYILAAKGFQFGGVQVNPPAPGFPESAQAAGYSFGPYKSSKLWNYEMGVRTEWLDRRLRFDTTLFYLDWRDLQLTISVPLQGTNVPFAVIANVGRAHSEGLESTLEVIPIEGAKLTSSVSIMTSATDELFDQSAADGGVKPGTQLPGAPHFQWSTVASYEHEVPYFTSWSISPNLTYAYVGEAPNEIRPTGTVGGYGTLDARLDLTDGNSRYLPEISLGMNNVTDVRGVTYVVGGNTVTSGAPYVFYHFVQPRTVVLSVSLRY